MAGGLACRGDEIGRTGEVTSLSTSRMATSTTSRQVQSRAQQIEAGQHVELAFAEGAQNLDPLAGFFDEIVNLPLRGAFREDRPILTGSGCAR